MTASTSPKVGDNVPPVEQTLSLSSMVAYAGATWDWHRMHYDPDFITGNGLPGPVVDGQVFGALLVKMIQDWLGARCFVQTLHFTFKSLVFAGETVRCSGSVTGCDAGAVVLDLRVDVLEADGAVGRAAVVPAGARVLLDTADGPGAT